MLIRWIWIILISCQIIVCLGCRAGNNTVAGTADGNLLDENSAVSFQVQNAGPNPSTSSVRLAFNIYHQQTLRISMYREDWRELRSVREAVFTAGEHILTVPLDDVADGVYYFVVVGAGSTQVISFIHMR